MFGVIKAMIPPFKNFPLGIRLAFIFALFCFNAILFGFVGELFLAPFYKMDLAKVTSICEGNFTANGDLYGFLLVQAVGSLGMFALTALLISQLETGFIGKRLAMGIRPAFKLVVVAIIGVLGAQLFIQFLVELNEKVPIPDALKFLAEQGKQAEKIELALMKGNSLLMFLANTLVLAVVPAFAEELFFRGLILGDLLKSKVNPAVAIISTGLLFSIAHSQFNNLLAIWVLGSFLGYLYYASGSLWLPVIAHFTNNFLLILLKYIYNAGLIKTDIAEVDIPLYATLVSTALFLVCFFILTKWRRPVDFELELGDPDLINEENYSE